MPEPFASFLLPVLWTLAGLVALWVLIPPVLHLFGLSRYRQHVESAPEDLVQHGNEPDYDDVCEQLDLLGFEPLGAFREYIRFFYFHWSKLFRSRVFVDRHRKCFANISRITERDPIRVAFATCLSDGTYLESGNAQGALQVTEDDWVRWGFVTSDMAWLLGKHEELVEKFRRGDRRPDVSADLHTLLRPIERVTMRHILADKVRTFHILKVSLFALLFMPFLAFLALGVGHWIVPTFVLTGGITWAAFLFGLPSFLKRERAREQRKSGQVPLVC